jgi:hypothetical protein
MKKHIKILLTLLLAVFTLTAFGQDDVTVMVYYMKVKPGGGDKYLALEQEWEKINKARVEQGYITGWQLWQKMYSGANDEYQYIVIEWYENYHKTFVTGFWEVIGDLYTEKEMEELSKKTFDTRVVARMDVMHRVATVETSMQTSYILVGQMKPKPGKESEYLKMEEEIFKPIHEEAVRTGQMTTWSVWSKWPYEENDAPYAVVNGFDDFSKILNVNYTDLFETVHPDMNMDDVRKLVGDVREMTGVQVWRLVHAIFPEEQHE